MWSGPRNISTAMMRSWENRADCSVIDEPFYAFYLAQTQHPHPMFDEILASQPSSYKAVAHDMVNGTCQTPLLYQKHMTHHMLAGCDLSWTKSLLHCFLIRDPVYVVNSYTNSRGECSVDDIGLVRQFELYEAISSITGIRDIPIIDAADVLRDPLHYLSQVCARLNIAFDEKMLNWPAGKRTSDGVWASHWYHSVEASTGFAAVTSPDIVLNASQQSVVDEVMPYYLALKKRAL
jgi:hypothetical protein